MPRPLALTLGEPAGIGPDITIAVWQRRLELGLAPFYVRADPEYLASRAKLLGVSIPIAVVEPRAASSTFATALPVAEIGVTATAKPGEPDRSSAPAALAAIRAAVADVIHGAAA